MANTLRCIASLMLSLTLAACAVGAAEDDPTQPMPVLDRKTGEASAGYLKAHERLVEEVKKKQPDLLLIGDSITYNWKAHGKEARKFYLDHRSYVNLGIGGDRVENILWRIQNGEVDGCRPKLAIVLAGTNNIPRKVTNEQIVSGMEAILTELRQRQPQMKILLVGVLPRGEAPTEERWKQAVAISTEYEKLADNKEVFFLDVSSRLLGEDGRFEAGMVCEDNLHLDREGYFAWAEAMEPIISRVLGDTPVERKE